MGRGRGRSAGACALAALVVTLAAAGCGAQTHENAPRPQPPTHVSVAITPDAVLVRPGAVGTRAVRTQQIPQNENQPQPQIHTRAPLSVVFVTANLTRTDSKLEVSGPREATSGPMVANGNGSFQIDLPAGTYTLSAADIPAAKPARLTVGTFRSSSQNNVLLP
jgi:hypothetical protein